uniref:Seroin transcript 1B n=1 Tax=Heliothis virescens TaxID=7102 RepID=A0A2A4IXY5_HELVI
MAVTIVFIVASLVAITGAGYPWADSDDEFPPFPVPMFRFAPMPKLRSMNTMPTFPMPYFPFPNFPELPQIPTIEDIAKANPGKGGSYSGVVVSSKHEMKRDEDGKLVKTGGSTILINNDGDVKIEKTGDSPPEIPQRNGFFKFDAPQPKPFKLNNMFKKFEFNFEPLDPERLKKYVPGQNEFFKGKSVRSHSSSSNVNGVVNQEASVVRVENDNGRVNEENISFRKGPER